MEAKETYPGHTVIKSSKVKRKTRVLKAAGSGVLHTTEPLESDQVSHKKCLRPEDLDKSVI